MVTVGRGDVAAAMANVGFAEGAMVAVGRPTVVRVQRAYSSSNVESRNAAMVNVGRGDVAVAMASVGLATAAMRTV